MEDRPASNSDIKIESAELRDRQEVGLVQALAVQKDPDSSASALQYVRDAPLVHRKALGQFFTPATVASLMADWVAAKGGERILDPALGTGILASACLDCHPSAQIVGYEKDRNISAYIPANIKGAIEVRLDDFLLSEVTSLFDGVIANPPYIRHREIEGYESAREIISSRTGCIIPRSANLYIYFMLKSLFLLKPGGRAAFLIPSEWMSANFSASFKTYLLERRLLRNIVTFSNCSAVFEDALTTASVLMIETSK